MNAQEQILSTLLSKKRGTFVGVKIESHIKGTALAVREGAEIRKSTRTTLRLGVNYAHISGVTPSSTRASWCHWEIPHLLAVHNTTGAKYVDFATVPGAIAHTEWRLNNSPVTVDDLVQRGYLTPSMATSRPTPFIRVALDNIREVN